jgi:hypothetical protein
VTTNDFIRAVLAELPPIPDEERAGVEAAIMAATYAGLSRLAALDAALQRDARRFEKTFTLTATAGDCPLADALAEDEPLLLEFFPNCSVYITGSDYAVPARLRPRAPDARRRPRALLLRPRRPWTPHLRPRWAVYGRRHATEGAARPHARKRRPPQDDALIKIVAAAVTPPAKPKPNRPKGTVTT